MSSPPTSASSFAPRPSALSLDQLDLVAVGVLHEGNHGGSALDGSRLASDRAALGTHRAARCRGVGNLDRNVSESGSQIVFIDAVVVGQLQHGVLGLVAVTDERQ